jgi:type IV fimbrial biogenesis protein FimT
MSITRATSRPRSVACQPSQLVATAGRRNHRDGTGGFTLVELMITIAISVILITVGIPGFSAFIRNQVLSAEARQFSMSLALARSQALARKEQISMCKSTNQSSCSTLHTVHWEDGWILFVDENADGKRQDGELVLRHCAGLPSSVSLRASDEYTNYIAFASDGRGFGNGDPTPPTEGTYSFCDARGAQHARVIAISPIGRARVEGMPGAALCP